MVTKVTVVVVGLNWITNCCLMKVKVKISNIFLNLIYLFWIFLCLPFKKVIYKKLFLAEFKDWSVWKTDNDPCQKIVQQRCVWNTAK